jgi:hypothetical protein
VASILWQQSYGSEIRNSRLHLSMAVAAKQNALLRLDSRLCKRSGDAPVTQCKRLFRRTNVMKMQGTYTTAVAAHRAGTSGIGHQYLLDSFYDGAIPPLHDI